MTEQEIAWLALKVLGVLGGLAGTAFAVFKAVSAVMAGKADAAQVERHKKANDDWFKRHHDAILDLYKKNDERREQTEHLREDMNKGFLGLTNTMHEQHAELLSKIGGRK